MRHSLVVAALLCAATASAQTPRGADTLGARAIADSQKVVADLEQRIRSNPKDAEAWHRIGMITWALATRAKLPGAPAGMDPTRLGRQADTSLRIAAETAPTNAYYRMDVAHFLLSSGYAMTRTAAAGQFDQALNAARKGTDSAAHAEAALELGESHWIKFDALANRRMTSNSTAAVRSLSQAMQPAADDPGNVDNDVPMFDLKAVRDRIDNMTKPLPPDVTGDNDYKQAAALFREAYDAWPSHPRAFRAVAMQLADHASWTELHDFASQHVRRIPWDPWGWMALGLATHRLGDPKNSAKAYDSALVYLDPSDRARLDNLERLLPRGDSSRVVRGTPAERQVLGQLYWAFADPLWSQSGNESRTEFLARVTYAELRWSVNELGVHGADTDRGDVYIRYGPPELVAVFGPSPAESFYEISTVWAYPTGLMFVFNGSPMFGTAHTAVGDEYAVHARIQVTPVRWDNLNTLTIDSMPSQVARFRGAADSVAVFVAARPQVDTLRTYAHGAPLKQHIWIVTPATQIAFGDSGALGDGLQSWSHSFVPGTYIARVEASAEGSTRAARSTLVINATPAGPTGFVASGAGLSDLLLATNAEPRGTAKRWNDFTVTPVVGPVDHASQLVFLWENYGFGQKNGSAQYKVSVTLTRVRSRAGQIAASVVGSLASAARITTGDGRASVSFDRTMPYSSTMVDQFALALGNTPAGTYTVTLEITDTISGQSYARTRTVRIRG